MCKTYSFFLMMLLQCFAVAQPSQRQNDSAATKTEGSSFPDVGVSVGVGSLITRGTTDYSTLSTNQVLQAQNKGRATPQILTGLVFTLPIPNFGSCLSRDALPGAKAPKAKDAGAAVSAPIPTATPGTAAKDSRLPREEATNATVGVSTPTPAPSAVAEDQKGSKRGATKLLSTQSAGKKDQEGGSGPCNSRPGWNKVSNPWQAVASLKLAPGSNDVLNGYLIGVSYSVASHFSLLSGFSLSPFHEPSPGFVNAAVQVVKNNQNLPIYQNFNPNDMLALKNNAFDGFPLLVQSATGPTGTQVYQGNPLITHYRGGFLFGVMFPLPSLNTLLGSTNKSATSTRESTASESSTAPMQPH